MNQNRKEDVKFHRMLLILLCSKANSGVTGMQILEQLVIKGPSRSKRSESNGGDAAEGTSEKVGFCSYENYSISYPFIASHPTLESVDYQR